MQKHELLLKVRYQSLSGEPVLSAEAVERALLQFYPSALKTVEVDYVEEDLFQ